MTNNEGMGREGLERRGRGVLVCPCGVRTSWEDEARREDEARSGRKGAITKQKHNSHTTNSRGRMSSIQPSIHPSTCLSVMKSHLSLAVFGYDVCSSTDTLVITINISQENMSG